jgi:hypothetical protein
VLQRRKYPRSIRKLAILGAVAAALAGCGGGSSPQGEPPAAPPTTSTSETTTTTATPENPLPGAATSMVVAPTTAKDTALLERVAIGRHEGFDRVVFQFRGEGLPSYRIGYESPPFVEDGSGDPVDVDGNAFVSVRMEPASGFDLNTGEGELVYKGPRRLPGAAIVTQAVRTGDFEAVLTWVIGLDARVPFLVTRASSPSRLIVDFRNS